MAPFYFEGLKSLGTALVPHPLQPSSQKDSSQDQLLEAAFRWLLTELFELQVVVSF